MQADNLSLQPFSITLTIDHYRPKQATLVLDIISNADTQALTALWSCQAMLATLTANLN